MTQKKHKKILMVILFISTLSQIGTDLYTPSLPAIAHYFHATMGQSQLTMTVFMLGLSITCLIYGPISEVIGRRKTLLLGIFISIIGILMCVFATNMLQLQIGRFLQGCGLGACATLWRSIFRDTYESKEMARVGSYLSNFFVLSVVLAPFLGGYFEEFSNWRLAFIFLSLWSILVLAIIFFVFKETSQHHGRHRLSVKFMFSTYVELLGSRKFMGYCTCSFLTYGGMFAWITGAPVVLIHGAGISPVIFGWLSVFVGAVVMLGSFINRKLVGRLGFAPLMQAGWFMILFSGMLMLFDNYVWGLTLMGVFIPALACIFATTLIFSNAFAGAFADIGHIAGYGAALYSGIQILGAAVFSGILSHLNTSNSDAIAWMFISSAVSAFLIYRFFVKAHLTK